MRLLCFANSKKDGGRCLAGLAWPDLEKWIRPVTGEGAVRTEQTFILDAGKDREIELFDLIDVPLTSPVPKPYHPEDWGMSEEPIRFIRKVPQEEVLERLFEISRNQFDLFGFSGDSIDSRDADRGLEASLTMVAANDVSFQKRGYQWRVLFNLGKEDFDLSLTDLQYRKKLQGVNSATINGECILICSLGEPFFLSKGQYRGTRRLYKLVVGVIPIRAGGYIT